MANKITKDQYKVWRSHPITKLFFETLKTLEQDRRTQIGQEFSLGTDTMSVSEHYYYIHGLNEQLEACQDVEQLFEAYDLIEVSEEEEEHESDSGEA